MWTDEKVKLKLAVFLINEWRYELIVCLWFAYVIISVSRRVASHWSGLGPDWVSCALGLLKLVFGCQSMEIPIGKDLYTIVYTNYFQFNLIHGTKKPPKNEKQICSL